MSKEVNLATLGKFAEAVNTGNFDLFKEAVAPGPDGYRMFFSQMRTAFPDLKVALEALVADDESIAIAYTLTGTHRGPLDEIPPSGRQIKIRGVQLSKFKDGKMVERWGSSDELGLLNQLGVAQMSRG